MSLSLSLSMSMSFSTSSICMYELHCYECVMHKSYGQHRATQCSQTLLLSSAHAASLHDYVHQLMAQCIRRQRHKPRTAYGEVATWLNLAEYTVSRTVLYPVKTNDGWSCLATFGHVWFPFCFSLWVFCRQKPCHGRSWRRDRASVFQPWLVSHSTFFLPRSTAAEAISTALLLVCFSQRLQ